MTVKIKPKTCKTCDRWGGYAVRKADQAGKDFLCLDPEAPIGTRKRADAACWRDGRPKPAPEPPVEPEADADLHCGDCPEWSAGFCKKHHVEIYSVGTCFIAAYLKQQAAP